MNEGHPLKCRRLPVLLAVACALVAAPAWANVAVVLANGNRLEVKAAHDMGDQVRLDLVAGGSIRLPKAAVKRVSRNAADLPAAGAGAAVVVPGASGAALPRAAEVVASQLPAAAARVAPVGPPVDPVIVESLFSRGRGQPGGVPLPPVASAGSQPGGAAASPTLRRGSMGALLTRVSKGGPEALGRPAAEEAIPGRKK